jgi:cellobiose phosphorylase
VSEWVLGVRPEWEGLRIDPCLPPSWDRARMTRSWRGATYDIRIERGGDGLVVQQNGRKVDDGLLPVPEPGENHEIVVRVE